MIERVITDIRTSCLDTWQEAKELLEVPSIGVAVTKFFETTPAGTKAYGTMKMKVDEHHWEQFNQWLNR